MRVRTFKPQFAELVKSGKKRQTIRPTPKRMPKTGDVESWRMWTGRPYNSPQHELVQVRLLSVEPIFIAKDGILLGENPGTVLEVWDEDRLAKKDGFKNFTEMAAWFKNEHGLPFEGILIKAEDL